MTVDEPGLIALLIFSPMGFSMLATVYMAHRHIEKIESLLPNCRLVQDTKKLYSHAGLLGKVLRTGTISLMLVVPRAYARKGLADYREVMQFPKRLRGWLVVLVLSVFIEFSALVWLRIWIL